MLPLILIARSRILSYMARQVVSSRLNAVIYAVPLTIGVFVAAAMMFGAWCVLRAYTALKNISRKYV